MVSVRLIRGSRCRNSWQFGSSGHVLLDTIVDDGHSEARPVVTMLVQNLHLLPFTGVNLCSWSSILPASDTYHLLHKFSRTEFEASFPHFPQLQSLSASDVQRKMRERHRVSECHPLSYGQQKALLRACRPHHSSLMCRSCAGLIETFFVCSFSVVVQPGGILRRNSVVMPTEA